MTVALAKSIRGLGAAVLQALPSFRGKYRLCNVVNTVCAGLGAPRLETAKMKIGTQLIVELTTQTERFAYYTGYYDRDFFDIVSQLYDPDSCFLDVGGNIGFYTTFAGHLVRKRGAAGHVLSFEPFSGNFSRLKENISLNDLDDYCTPINLGLSDEEGQCTITLREDFFSGSDTGNAAITTDKQFDAGYETAIIQLTTLDLAWEKYAQPGWRLDVVKLDVEGHEDFFLRGAEKTIAVFRPTILMEVNKPYYEARKVDLDTTFLPLIPANYAILRIVDGRCDRITSLHACRCIDNVFLVPEERFGQARFSCFRG
jgi:FkbM family methyltransferase